MFLHVSVCPQGGVPGQVPLLGRYTNRAGTPPDRYPLGRYPPGRYTPKPWAATPPWQVPPAATPQAGNPGKVHPPEGTPPGQVPPGHSACWDSVNKRAVRIPLECILDGKFGLCKIFHGTSLL